MLVVDIMTEIRPGKF